MLRILRLVAQIAVLPPFGYPLQEILDPAESLKHPPPRRDAGGYPRLHSVRNAASGSAATARDAGR
jgi:hypothetical protein